MNLYVIQKYSQHPLMVIADPSIWYALGVSKEHVLFEPGEDAEVLRGTCLIMNSPIKFTEWVDGHYAHQAMERIYVLSENEPLVHIYSDNRRVITRSELSAYQ